MFEQFRNRVRILKQNSEQNFEKPEKSELLRFDVKLKTFIFTWKCCELENINLFPIGYDSCLLPV